MQQVLQPAMETSYEAEAADILHHANAAPAAPTQQTVLMEQMLQMMQLMQQQMQQSSSSRSNTKSNKMQKIDKYCWMHGGCAHSSKDCRNKNLDTRILLRSIKGWVAVQLILIKIIDCLDRY